jgi:hypothetical protein
MKRLYLVPALGLAALALTTPVRAQSIDLRDANSGSYRDDDRQPYYEAGRRAYENGYRDGLRDGQNDGRRRSNRDYRNERVWQRADRGYNRSYGDIEGYRQQFRSGYSAGYVAGYQRYGPYYGYGGGRAVPRRDPYPDRRYPGGYQYPGGYGYPGQYGYGNPAFSIGRNDGYEKGQEDGRKNRSYDPLRHKWYRSGDHDYKNQYGPKDRYRDTYRQGFKEGYDRGYREWSYRY